MEEDNNFLYRFLMSPRFRAGRHLLMILVVSSYALNNVAVTFQDTISLLGNSAFLIFLYTFIVFLLAGYFNLHILIPRYLLKRKYIRYFVFLYLSCCMQIFFIYWMEAFVHPWYNIIPGKASYLNKDYFSAFSFLSEILLLGLAHIGVSLAVMIQYWIRENQRIGYLEQVQLRSEVEQLKEQVNPGFLYNILHCSGSIAVTEPDRASEMLMNLSRLLRYQLYDGSHEKSLLSAEIQYLVNYLKLENLSSGKISFDISKKGDIATVFLPPLLFLPLVRYAVGEVYKQYSAGHLSLYFKVMDDYLTFAVNISSPNPHEHILEKEEFQPLKQRLDFLYKGKYSLNTGEYNGSQGIFIILSLERELYE